VHAGGGHARADSTVKMITHGAALLGPQGHDHPLGCRYLHLLGDAPQRHRGPPLGGSSSVWRSSRRGLACSSASSSSDESFCTCLEHARNVMNLCSFMRMAELLALQPLLSGAVVFGACVCGRVTTRLVQTCAVTLREHVGSSRRPWSGNKKISADGHVHTKQGHLWAKQPVAADAAARSGDHHRIGGSVICHPQVAYDTGVI